MPSGVNWTRKANRARTTARQQLISRSQRQRQIQQRSFAQTNKTRSITIYTCYKVTETYIIEKKKKMSASPTARQAFSHALPMAMTKTKKVVITDPIQMPEVYSSTPGGTLYSTTPGGTKVIYERAFMKNLRGSPLSQTPPSNIPSCLLRGTPRTPFRKCVPVPTDLAKKTQSLKIEEQEQFQLEL